MIRKSCFVIEIIRSSIIKLSKNLYNSVKLTQHTNQIYQKYANPMYPFPHSPLFIAHWENGKEALVRFADHVAWRLQLPHHQECSLPHVIEGQDSGLCDFQFGSDDDEDVGGDPYMREYDAENNRAKSILLSRGLVDAQPAMLPVLVLPEPVACLIFNGLWKELLILTHWHNYLVYPCSTRKPWLEPLFAGIEWPPPTSDAWKKQEHDLDVLDVPDLDGQD